MTWWMLLVLLLAVLALVALWALCVVASREEERTLREWAGRVGVTVRREPPDQEDDWR